MAHWLPGRFSQKDRTFGSVPMEKTQTCSPFHFSFHTPSLSSTAHTHPLLVCRLFASSFVLSFTFSSSGFPFFYIFSISWIPLAQLSNVPSLPTASACMHAPPTPTSPHTHMHAYTQTHLLVLSYNVTMAQTESNHTESIGPLSAGGLPLRDGSGECAWGFLGRETECMFRAEVARNICSGPRIFLSRLQ